MSMTKGESLYNLCEPDTRWAPVEHDCMTTEADGKKRWGAELKFGAKAVVSLPQVRWFTSGTSTVLLHQQRRLQKHLFILIVMLSPVINRCQALQQVTVWKDTLTPLMWFNPKVCLTGEENIYSSSSSFQQPRTATNDWLLYLLPAGMTHPKLRILFPSDTSYRTETLLSSHCRFRLFLSSIKAPAVPSPRHGASSSVGWRLCVTL